MYDIQKSRDLQERPENAILDTNQKAMNKIDDEDVENIQNALNICSYKEKENRECVEKDQAKATAQDEETYIIERFEVKDDGNLEVELVDSASKTVDRYCFVNYEGTLFLGRIAMAAHSNYKVHVMQKAEEGS